MKHQTNQPHITHPESRLGRGFTLVELLVVITIIVALAAVIFAVTRNIRSRAFQANAMSSLRQVAVASMAYTTENNGDINTLRWLGDPKEGAGGYVKNSFWGRLQPHLFPDVSQSNQPQLKKALLLCLSQLFNTDMAAGSPANPKGTSMPGTILSGSKIYHDGSGLPVPIAFNANLYKWNEFLKISSFSDPNRVIFSVYGFGMFDEADGQSYEPRPTNNTKPANNIYYLDDKKALAAFLDGHIDTVSPPIGKQNLE